MNEQNPEFMTDGKEFFVVFSTPLVTGYMPVPIPKASPILHWHGPKIDLATSWYPALRFMQEHHRHEVVLRLFMTRDRSEILIFPLTQIYGTGMSVKEEITKEEREWWAAEGLIEAGTVHSHCEAGAFASGTDTDDERARDGLHMTIGKLKSSQFDIHARMTWTIPGEERDGQIIRAAQTTTQSADLSEWFHMPPHVVQFIAAEPELEDSVIKYMLTKPPPKTLAYPEPWKTKLIERRLSTMPSMVPHESMAMWGSNMQRELSMADDIPSSKKKERAGASREERKQFLDNTVLWDTWQEVMDLINQSTACRAMQVAVSDFAPDMRAILFHQCPPAHKVWEDIMTVIIRAGLSEDEFFDEFGKDPRVS
jgi:hypothetical protein